jgi:glycosyltransferase involved in cell wall biosynthesis
MVLTVEILAIRYHGCLMNNFRLGLSSTTIEPALTGGHVDGIGVYTHQLLNYFNQLEEITVTPIAYPRLLRSIPTSALANGRFWPVSYTIASMVSLFTQRPLLNAPIDIYHATDYRIPKLRCPVVASLHDAIPLQHPEWANSRFRAQKNFMMKKTAQWIDHVIAISYAAVNDVSRYFNINENKISVVHMGVDEKWLKPLSSETLQKLLQPLHLPQHYFLFVGTLQPRKNILRILQAFQALPSKHRHERKLVIVGKAGWCIDEALQLLNKLATKNEVIWLKNIHDELTLRALYQAAGVFVFPSLYEGFGIPLLEAFASRVPVITSNINALPEVSAGAAVEVNPYEVTEITEGMLRLCEDDALRLACIEKGIARVKDMTWRKCALETFAVYRKLL